MKNESYHEIPKQFYDTVEEKPIEQCLMCQKNLYNGFEPYLIEKAFRKSEAVFEYAICLNCAAKSREQMSKESRERVEEYMKNNMPAREEIMEQKTDNEEEWMGKCLISGKSKDDCEEYQIFGLFIGNHMISNEFPYMIGGEVLDEIQELLSPETRDELDRFKDEFFDIPPELQELFKDSKVLLF